MKIDDVLAKLGPDGDGLFGRAAFPALRLALTLAQQEARAERDREWREAIEESNVGGFIADPCNCDRCAPLRALLEGK